jgi:RND family efflux transporter MFP subunit
MIKMISMKGILSSISLAAVLFISGCAGKPEEGNNTDTTPVLVAVSKPVQNSDGNMMEISGQIESAQTANISTRLSGYITGIYAKTGDPVRAGQLLFTISSQDISAKKAQADAQVAQGEAALGNAQKELDRFNVLYKQQSATARELDNANLQFQVAKAGLETAKQLRNEVVAQESYTQVTAPFDGIVTKKLMDVGNLAVPGMPVLILEQGKNLQVSADVPESQIAGVKTGSLVQVNVKSAGKTFTGTIIQLSPSSQSTGGQYIIKISVPEQEKKGLYSGMYVNARLQGQKNGTTGASHSNQLLIPETCIIRQNELTGLYTLSQHQTALLRWVRLGKSEGNMVEVLSGLGSDESFIVHADGKLYNGAPVKIAQ